MRDRLREETSVTDVTYYYHVYLCLCVFIHFCMRKIYTLRTWPYIFNLRFREIGVTPLLIS